MDDRSHHSLPVSVVIPHQKSRADFFQAHCLPSVRRNAPAEIIIEEWDGGAPQKRNAGAARARQPYLLFVDDDVVLRPGAIATMVRALERYDAAFAYSDYDRVIHRNIPCPYRAGVFHVGAFDPKRLLEGNFIETTSLLRRSLFPGFDTALRRFQDWDLWLRLTAAGHRGVYIPEVLLELHHIDRGISVTEPFDECVKAIKEKHGLS